MDTIKIYPSSNKSPATSPLPRTVQTPSGLALLELQGIINLPKDAEGEPLGNFNFGRLVFPDYRPDAIGSAWMKRVYLYIGQHQRLNGEVKKLPKALAVIRRKSGSGSDADGEAVMAEGDGQSESLEVVEIIKYKLMFAGRPEPVGTAHAPS